MTHILDAKHEESQAKEAIDWNEREALAYPELLANQFETLKKREEKEVSNSEKEAIVRHYKEWKLKRLTCRKFDISKPQLEKIIKEEGLV